MKKVKNLNSIWQKIQDMDTVTKTRTIIVIVAVLCLLIFLIRHGIDSASNQLELIAGENEVVEISEKEAEDYNLRDLVKESTGRLEIQGTIDQDSYKKQKITFISKKGTSTKTESIYVKITKPTTDVTIDLYNDIVNVTLSDTSFVMSDVVKKIGGETITYLSQSQVYTEKVTGRTSIAYFYSKDYDLNTVGMYQVQLIVIDADGNESHAYFAVQVCRDKEVEDKDIKDLREKAYAKGGVLYNVKQSDNVTIHKKIVDPVETTSTDSTESSTESSTETDTSQSATSSDTYTDSYDYSTDYYGSDGSTDYSTDSDDSSYYTDDYGSYGYDYYDDGSTGYDYGYYQ